MENTVDMKIVVNTLNSLRGQVTSFLGRPHQFPERSTINEQLKIMHGVRPAADQRPVARYMVIGNRGHGVDMSDPEVLLPYPIEHRPTDVGAWGPIPFVLRPVDNDLSDAEREMFGLRTLEEHFGERYWAYYGYNLDHSAVTCIDYEMKVRDGKAEIKEFNYTEVELRSKPPLMPEFNMDITDQIELADGDYVYTYAVISLTLNEYMIKEFQNVAKIKFKDARRAVISEYVLCSGVSQMATGQSFVGPEFNYMEMVGLQAVLFLTTYTNAALSNKKIGYDVTIGQTEPMPVNTGATRS